MNNSKVLVVGATGKTGGAVATQLLEKGYPVRAMVHSLDARAKKLEKLGAEIVSGSVFDYDQVARVMQGTQRAYFNLAFHPHIIQATTIFAVAATKTKLESIVSLGQWLSTPRNPSLLTRDQWLTEQLFFGLPGITHTSVSPGYFADNYLGGLMATAANLGIYPWPYGDTYNAPPSNEDIARVAVGALIDPERHNGHSYRPTGPELLSGQDITNKIAGVLNRSVKRVDMEPVQYLKALQTLGIPPYIQLGVRSYLEEHRQGAFSVSAPTDHVLIVGGQAAEPFEVTAKRYADAPGAEKSLRNTTHQILNFLKTSITPSFKFEEYERAQSHPHASKPLFAMQDEEWKFTHGKQFVDNAKTALAV